MGVLLQTDSKYIINSETKIDAVAGYGRYTRVDQNSHE